MKFPRARRGLPNSSQFSQETAQRRALAESRRGPQEQYDGAEKRIVELEGELAAAREKFALLEDEKRSLQLAVDQGLNMRSRASPAGRPKARIRQPRPAPSSAR